MESSLKNLFFRRRSKSKPPVPNDAPQESFQQTSSYAAVSSGPAPKVGALPLKPSREKQPRRSFTHTKAKSDGLQENCQIAESANIGRPRTSPGVKPYFVGVSRPAGSGTPSGPSSRGTSIDIPRPDNAEPPPVPPLPKDLESLRGPRYHDIMQFAAKQQISRATFNEHVAARNMALPRKSVDLFEVEVNQLSGGRYNEYVAMRNVDPPCQSIDRFEEEVALRNAASPDPQLTKFDVMRASREGRFQQGRSKSVDNAPNRTPGPGMLGPETSANTHVTRTSKSKPARTGDDGQRSAFDALASATASKPQATPSPRPAAHSRKHSIRENDHLGAFSSIPQSRPADFMPPEWLSQGTTKASVSSDTRTRPMTATIPARLANQGLGVGSDSALTSTGHELKRRVQMLQQNRKQPTQHSASRSLSLLEGGSRRAAYGSTIRTGLSHQVVERPARHEKQSSIAGSAHAAPISQDVSQGPLESDASSPRSSMVMSTTSSVTKWIEPSGRTVLDLTSERPDSSSKNASSTVYLEPPRKPQQKAAHDASQLGQPGKPPDQFIVVALGQHAVGELGSLESLRDPEAPSPQVEIGDKRDTPTTTRPKTGKANVVAAGLPGGDEITTFGSTIPQAAVSELTRAQPTSIHNQVTIPVESSTGESRHHGLALDPDPKQKVFGLADHVNASPESLKSKDFADPRRTFGVTARDFAVSPIPRESHDALRKPAPGEESVSGKVISSLAKTCPVGQEKVVHHISSFTFPAKQPRSRQSSRDQIAFDEDAFQRKQAEARAALFRLDRDLQENFTFAFDSLKHSSGRDVSVHVRDLSLEEGGSLASISRFSSVQAPTSLYQNRANGSSSRADTAPTEMALQRGPSDPALAVTGDVSNPAIPNMTRKSKRNSTISTISESDAEPQATSAPAPSIPLSSVSDRGRSITSRPAAHGRMHSTASTGSGTSAFSVPHHLVPERTSSMRDSEVPLFNMDDARWE